MLTYYVHAGMFCFYKHVYQFGELGGIYYTVINKNAQD